MSLPLLSESHAIFLVSRSYIRVYRRYIPVPYHLSSFSPLYPSRRQSDWAAASFFTDLSAHPSLPSESAPPVHLKAPSPPANHGPVPAVPPADRDSESRCAAPLERSPPSHLSESLPSYPLQGGGGRKRSCALGGRGGRKRSCAFGGGGGSEAVPLEGGGRPEMPAATGHARAACASARLGYKGITLIRVPLCS